MKVQLPGYKVEVGPKGAEGAEPAAKKRKKERVHMEDADQRAYLSQGPEDKDGFLILIEELQSCNIGMCDFVWFLKAQVDGPSSTCTLQLAGIAILPGSKGLEMSATSQVIIADATERLERNE